MCIYGGSKSLLTSTDTSGTSYTLGVPYNPAGMLSLPLPQSALPLRGIAAGLAQMSEDCGDLSLLFYSFPSFLKYSPQEPGFSLSEKEKGENENQLYGVKLENRHQCELMILNT